MPARPPSQQGERAGHARPAARWEGGSRAREGMRIVERMGSEAIGWFSSFVLVLTIGNQVYKQWKTGTSKGVSKWLFVGQITASTGFTVYSWMVHNWVFVVTNSLMLVSALVGIVIVLKHRKAEKRGAERSTAPSGASPARA